MPRPVPAAEFSRIQQLATSISSCPSQFPTAAIIQVFAKTNSKREKSAGEREKKGGGSSLKSTERLTVVVGMIRTKPLWTVNYVCLSETTIHQAAAGMIAVVLTHSVVQVKKTIHTA